MSSTTTTRPSAAAAVAHFLKDEEPPFGIADYTSERPRLVGDNGVPDLIPTPDNGGEIVHWQWFVCGKAFVSTFVVDLRWDAGRIREASFKAHADLVAKVRQVLEAGIAATGGEVDIR